MSDNFGDRMKAYERQETARRFMPGIPVYARIDGRSFTAHLLQHLAARAAAIRTSLHRNAAWRFQGTGC